MISLPWVRKRRQNKGKEAKSPPNSELLPGVQIDEVEIEIEGVTMRLKRKVNLDVPHEVSAFIPRAEIRRRKFVEGKIKCEEEVLLNSITIVHAPRHPLAGEPSPGGNAGGQNGLTPGTKTTKFSPNNKSNFVPKINFKYNC